MYGWLKYVAVALIVAVFGKIIYDVIKAAKADGGDWKDILFRVLLWFLLFSLILALNLCINRNWAPGDWYFTIGF
ncbi:MAG: hypothetical protein MJY76_00845 [Bacteroidales bacterium]|nr:hypothetical protein [Bacteroidales bacterium]